MTKLAGFALAALSLGLAQTSPGASGLGVGGHAQGFSLATLAGESLNVGGLIGRKPLLLWFTNL